MGEYPFGMDELNFRFWNAAERSEEARVNENIAWRCIPACWESKSFLNTVERARDAAAFCCAAERHWAQSAMDVVRAFMIAS